VTAGTFLLAGYAECFHTAVACATGFGFLHFSHGKVLFVSQAEDRIMANSAIIVVFFQMKFVTEYDWIGVFEIEFDVFSFRRINASN
jgi:hypothetical protein